MRVYMQIYYDVKCKFTMMCYASSSSYVMQVWYASCHMICKLCYAKFGIMHTFEAKWCNMQVYGHMYISYATMLNLWLQHPYVMIYAKFPLSILYALLRYVSDGIAFGVG